MSAWRSVEALKHAVVVVNDAGKVSVHVDRGVLGLDVEFDGRVGRRVVDRRDSGAGYQIWAAAGALDASISSAAIPIGARSRFRVNINGDKGRTSCSRR